MRLRRLQRLWRRLHLRDSEEVIPPAGAAADAPPGPGGTAFVFDPQDPALIADPYPVYRYLREQDPVHRSAAGAWVLSRYADVAAALADDRLGNAPSEYATVNIRNAERYVCADLANHILPFLDPPEHGAPRKLISHGFHQYLLGNPPPLEEIAGRLLADLPRAGEFDLLSRFATPFSARVFCQLLGADDSDIPRLLGWSDRFFYLLTMIPSWHARIEIDQALTEFRDFIGQLVERRKRDPGADFVSYLLRSNEASARLEDIQLIDNLILLFADGVENVDKAICNGLALLLDHPDQRELLASRPELLSRAVDECLRFESPAQMIGRVARRDLEIHGHRVRRNEAVFLLLGSANRDPAQFIDADSFDITRKPNPHLSFGKSRHGCVGGIFVRQEMRAALKAILEHRPGLERRGEDLTWQPRMGHRWLTELRLRC